MQGNHQHPVAEGGNHHRHPVVEEGNLAAGAVGIQAVVAEGEGNLVEEGGSQVAEGGNPLAAGEDIPAVGPGCTSCCFLYNINNK